jgi:hypothetical protein
MLSFEHTLIESVAIHGIGNKLNEEGIRFSKELLKTDSELDELLQTYFFTSFRQEEYYTLFHDSDLNLNEVYTFAAAIFDDPGSLMQQSANLARHLYEQSAHPRIKSGEFYVAYFTNCQLDGDETDAIGLFKSENKDTFLKLTSGNQGYVMEGESGINIHKLDKGCLIFNTDRSEGFRLLVVDNLNRGNEARYWIDQFLRVQPRNDSFFQTRNALSLCRSFVVEKLPEQFDVSKADQADMLNRSVKFFKENETFDMDEFAEEVIGSPEVINSFKSYKTEYEDEQGLQVETSFDISDKAVKKQSRVFKSVIKLDKNFHIYVHGDHQQIVKGFDEESGMHYYQLFFREES